MASSSSPRVFEYDVFLSFRGKDTRRNIVSHLHKALKDKKINTFIDDEELERGEEISSALITAIKESKISVIIFSENYPDSKWSLDELVKILECRKELDQIVVPVFHYVEPTDVRNQTWKFGSSFDRLPNKYESKKEGWRIALKEAGDLSGWESSKLESEAILLKRIIAYILGKLKECSKNDDDSEGLNAADYERS